jgi:hypothetical protein
MVMFDLLRLMVAIRICLQLIRYDDGRQQLQGKAAKKLAESIY